MGVKFEWHSNDPRFVLTEPEPPPRTRRPLRRLLFASLALLILVGAIALLARRGARAASADLQRQVGAEILALQAGERDIFLAFLDSSQPAWKRYHEKSFAREAAWFAARAGARPQIENVELSPDQATVHLLLHDGTQTWRSTWFYRRVGGVWRHAGPAYEPYDTTCRVSTPHITLIVPTREREAMTPLAEDLEDLYLRLSQTYHLGAPGDETATPRSRSAQGPIVIRIVPYLEADPGLGVRWSVSLPSPDIALEMWTPDERTAYLGRVARTTVARTLFRLGRERRTSLRGEQWLLESLALWHAGAWQPQWRPYVQSSLADGTLSRLLTAWSGGSQAARQESTPAGDSECTQALSYTLGEYLVATYPPERLCALVQATGQEESSWAALRGVLGLDRAQLEAAWSAHLRQQYGAR